MDSSFPAASAGQWSAVQAALYACRGDTLHRCWAWPCQPLCTARQDVPPGQGSGHETLRPSTIVSTGPYPRCSSWPVATWGITSSRTQLRWRLVAPLGETRAGWLPSFVGPSAAAWAAAQLEPQRELLRSRGSRAWRCQALAHQAGTHLHPRPSPTGGISGQLLSKRLPCQIQAALRQPWRLSLHLAAPTSRTFGGCCGLRRR